MADITMCMNELCPNAQHCHRVRAVPSDYQSWAMFQYTVSGRGVECAHYWPEYEIKHSNTTDV